MEVVRNDQCIRNTINNNNNNKKKKAWRSTKCWKIRRVQVLRCWVFRHLLDPPGAVTRPYGAGILFHQHRTTNQRSLDRDFMPGTDDITRCGKDLMCKDDAIRYVALKVRIKCLDLMKGDQHRNLVHLSFRNQRTVFCVCEVNWVKEWNIWRVLISQRSLRRIPVILERVSVSTKTLQVSFKEFTCILWKYSRVFANVMGILEDFPRSLLDFNVSWNPP